MMKKKKEKKGNDDLLGIGVVGKRLNSVVNSRIRCPLKAALSPGVQPRVEQKGGTKQNMVHSIHAAILVIYLDLALGHYLYIMFSTLNSYFYITFPGFLALR